jgi:hypothetical protein
MSQPSSPAKKWPLIRKNVRATRIVPGPIKRYIRRLLTRLRPVHQEPAVDYWENARRLAPRYRKNILYGQEGNDRISQLLATGRPLMVTRLGWNELLTTFFYVNERIGNRNTPYPPDVAASLSQNAGFFPATEECLDRFARLMLDGFPNADVMGVWFAPDHEHIVCNTYCPGADLVEFGCIEPFHYKNPWTAQLAGRRVLVVHPFAESIRSQYSRKRTQLFADPQVLPEFELTTLKAVQSIAGHRVDFATWFDAHDHMCREIAKIDFDVAIIGAGAYGLPLATYVKGLGKQAIHMGGVTQILFGIKGKRWETAYADTTAKLFNEHWIRPSKSETPKEHRDVEGGCYW